MKNRDKVRLVLWIENLFYPNALRCPLGGAWLCERRIGHRGQHMQTSEGLTIIWSPGLAKED